MKSDFIFNPALAKMFYGRVRFLNLGFNSDQLFINTDLKINIHQWHVWCALHFFTYCTYSLL